jgi:hypothetical protein
MSWNVCGLNKKEIKSTRQSRRWWLGPSWISIPRLTGHERSNLTVCIFAVAYILYLVIIFIWQHYGYHRDCITSRA